MNYGQSQAIMLLAGERMGFTMNNAENAKQILRGVNVHPMFAAAVSKEATELHNSICDQPEKVAQANAACVALIAEYNLDESADSVKIDFENDANFITANGKDGTVMVRCNFGYTDCRDAESLDAFIRRHGGPVATAKYLAECYSAASA